MPYDKDTPASINETFSVSQPKITANFNSIKTLVDQDHETFGAANEGKHKQVTLPDMTIVALTTPLATSATEIMLYADAGKLKLRPAGQLAGVQTNEFNLTPSKAGHAASGYEVLPSGLKFAWGTGNASGNGAVIPFPFGVGFGSIYQVIITKFAASGSQDFVYITAKTTANFTAACYTRHGNNSAAVVSYLAIGN